MEPKLNLPQLPFDVLCYIGDHIDGDSLVTLSLTSKTLRDAMRYRTFSTVYITGTWEAAEMRVALIAKSGICPLVRAVKIHIKIVEGNDTDKKPDRSIPRPDFPFQLRDMLNKMERLNSLIFSIPKKTTQFFKDAFSSDPSWTWPSITKLALSPYTHFLVDYCPSLRVVSTYGRNEWLNSTSRDHSFGLIQSVFDRPLEHFAMIAWWTESLTEAVVNALPNTAALTMEGGGPFSKQIQILGQFKCLKRLHILGEGHLYFGFVPYLSKPGCRWGAPPLAEQVDREIRSAEERIVEDLSTACPHLEEVIFFSSTTVLIERGQGGMPTDFIWMSDLNVEA